MATKRLIDKYGQLFLARDQQCENSKDWVHLMDAPFHVAFKTLVSAGCYIGREPLEGETHPVVIRLDKEFLVERKYATLIFPSIVDSSGKLYELTGADMMAGWSLCTEINEVHLTS